MKNNIIWLPSYFRLKAKSNPPMGIVRFTKIQGSYRIGKGKELTVLIFRPFQSIGKQLVFMIEHLLQTRTTHIASVCLSAINGIAKSHIVCTHSFSDGSRRRSSGEKISCYFLSGTYFRKSAVDLFT